MDDLPGVISASWFSIAIVNRPSKTAHESRLLASGKHNLPDSPAPFLLQPVFEQHVGFSGANARRNQVTHPTVKVSRVDLVGTDERVDQLARNFERALDFAFLRFAAIV